MDVFVSRSGGIAGIRLTWHVSVDEQPDADEWFLLIEEIPWNEVPPAPPEPDRFTWDIRCEGEKAPPPQEATLAERQLTGPWRELVDRVQETADPTREKPQPRQA